jgi:small subunit ribosomal protein S20
VRFLAPLGMTNPRLFLTTLTPSASLPVHKFRSMANTKSAGKRARQNPRRTLRNRSVTTQLRSLTKRHATGGKAEDMRALISALDKAAKRGIIHRNVAKRRKARLNKAAAKTSAA